MAIDKIILYFSFLLVFTACKNKTPETVELITNISDQDSIFKNLINLTNYSIPENKQDDSLAFLILPVQASCPACRKKTIDSIVEHKENISDNQFIIITASAGRKTIRSYFLEQDKELPVIPDRLFLDSTNMADKFNLFDAKPTIYYTSARKAYKKVASVPATIKNDLNQFFLARGNSKAIVGMNSSKK